MTPLEVTYRAFVNCLNEGRWADLGTFLHSEFFKNEHQYTPKSYAAQFQGVGSVETTVEAIMADEEGQRMASTNLVKWKPSKDISGSDSTDKTILFVEQNLIWFTEGKLSKTITLADREGIVRQLSDPQAIDAPNLITMQTGDEVGEVSQSRDDLEQTYRGYVGCINERTMKANLHNFVHPRVIHNGKTLTLDEFRRSIEANIMAVPDLVVAFHTVIVDEKAQRVAARLESTGTPVVALGGAEPTGNQSRFAEHVTYQFRGGKISSLWSIGDWIQDPQALPRSSMNVDVLGIGELLVPGR